VESSPALRFGEAYRPEPTSASGIVRSRGRLRRSTRSDRQPPVLASECARSRAPETQKDLLQTYELHKLRRAALKWYRRPREQISSASQAANPSDAARRSHVHGWRGCDEAGALQGSAQS
jgi:hypothetical protein